jgi:iron complex outermembrane receptor protein
MMTSIKQARLFVTGLIILLPFTASAVLPEITVTADRTEESLQAVPVAVSAFGMEDIQNAQIDTAQDLQRLVPSLNMFNNITTPTNLSPSLRGGLQQDASIVTAESPFGIYVDGVYVGRLNANNVTLSDIERVEVLRGPQGTLYGRNTGYGAIKFISRTPNDEFWFDASIGAGNDNQFLLKSSIGGPIGGGWAASLAAQSSYKKGQYFNIAENTAVDKRDDKAARGKLNYSSDNFQATLSVSIADSENDAMPLVNGVTLNDPDGLSQFTTEDLTFSVFEAFPDQCGSERCVSSPFGQLSPAPFRDRPQGTSEQSITGLTLEWDLNDSLIVKSITGYVALDFFAQTDFSGVGAIQFASDVDSDQFSQELLLIGDYGPINFTVGAYYLEEDSTQSLAFNFGFPVSQSFIDTSTDSQALFGDIGWQVTDALKLSAGARWTEDDKTMNFDYLALYAPIPGSSNQYNVKDDDVLTRFVVEYTVSEDMMIYGSRAEGFKGSGFSAIALFSADGVGAYDPEENVTWEAGLKADWFDNTLRTNLAYFYSEIDEIQQNATDLSNPAQLEFPVQNSGDAEIKGLEFEISAVLWDNLDLFLVGSLMDGKFTRLNADSAAAAARTLLGVEPTTPQTPDYSYSIGFDYTLPCSRGACEDVSFGANYYKTDDYVTAATNEFRNSGWDQVNAHINVDVDENWQLALTGKNLADDFIVVSGSRALGGFVSLPGREVMLMLNYRH